MFSTPSFSDVPDRPNAFSGVSSDESVETEQDVLSHLEERALEKMSVERQVEGHVEGPLPLLKHVDFLLYLARKLGKEANFLKPFPKMTEQEVTQEVLAYNRTHPKVPVCTHNLSEQYEQLKNVCQSDGGPLYRSNSQEVTIKDVIEQSLANLDENAKKSRDYWV